MVAWGLMVGVGSCVKVDGGAVVLTWVVRSTTGRAIAGCSCADPAIDHVHIAVVDTATAADLCQGRKGCDFSCDAGTGATPFFLPAGSYAVSIRPSDASGQDLTQPGPGRTQVVDVPAPILRDIVFGQVAELETFQIVAACAPGCSSATSSGTCQR